jgi:hypothetical protein
VKKSLGASQVFLVVRDRIDDTLVCHVDCVVQRRLLDRSFHVNFVKGLYWICSRNYDLRICKLVFGMLSSRFRPGALPPTAQRVPDAFFKIGQEFDWRGRVEHFRSTTMG